MPYGYANPQSRMTLTAHTAHLGIGPNERPNAKAADLMAAVGEFPSSGATRALGEGEARVVRSVVDADVVVVGVALA